MKMLTKILIIAFILIYATTPAFAHKMIIRPVEDGIIEVGYVDGTFSDLIKVRVYNSKNEVILEGGLDTEGYFHFDPSSDAIRIVAEDGMGHRVVWRVGDPTAFSADKYKWLKVAAVVMVLITISFVFHKRSSKKTAI